MIKKLLQIFEETGNISRLDNHVIIPKYLTQDIKKKINSVTNINNPNDIHI